MFIAKMEAICVLICIVSCWCPVTGRNCHPPWNWWPVKHHWGHGSWCVSGVFHVGFGLLNGSVSLADWLCLELYILYIQNRSGFECMYINCHHVILCGPVCILKNQAVNSFLMFGGFRSQGTRFCNKDCLLLVGETQHIVIKRFSGCQKNVLIYSRRAKYEEHHRKPIFVNSMVWLFSHHNPP